MDSQRNPPFATQRPGFAASASGPESASSVSRSSSSLSTMSSAAVPIAGASSHPQQFQNSSAPIPPSSPVQQTHFMGSIPAATAAPLASQLQFPPQQAQAPPPARPAGLEYNPNREGAGRTAQETAAFLNEYSLVAEAAKRAQMAVLMRDMEAVELS
ncbi:hypothetical protein HDK90DRAFT_512451 [Phyllosticta capitalensis]|uniref:Uncharacterized protein n=1 Tax=Phyllosticta capitalensis TaxID=121624 RepID=A0ABR1YLU7_9PEZI